MIVNVHMADGRTTFQFASRGDLRKAIHNTPDSEHPVLGWVRWNPGDDWTYLRTSYVRSHSIAAVVDARAEAGGIEADLPALVEAEKRRRNFEQRQVETTPEAA